ncbi:MAG: prolyl oligopeptidase family serine peptidase [Gammaproteobacteria bacterium]
MYSNPSTPAPATQAHGQHAQYQLPPEPLQAIVDAARPPALALSPQRNLAAMIDTPALPGIDEVAQPELKLAGLRINPRSYTPSRASFGSDLAILNLDTRQQTAVQGLPKPLHLVSTAWSPDQRYLAFSHMNLKGAGAAAVELWLVDVATASARRLSTRPLAYLSGSGFGWLPNAKGLLVYLKPAAGAAPVDPGVPSGPNIQESVQDGGDSARTRQLRTYADLLRNEYDARLFEHYATTQLALVDLSGKVKKLGAPDMFIGASVSPNGQYIVTQALQRPFSFIVPAASFARRIEVRDIAGKPVHLVANRPLVEGLPPGNDAVPQGVRNVSWRTDAPATLVWSEAQDGGDPAVPAEVRDLVWCHAAPFERPPEVLARLATRYSEILWGRGDLALITEGWYKTRAVKIWRMRPDTPGAALDLVFAYSEEDRYSNPGDPATMSDGAGRQRLLIGPNDSILLNGEGASEEGDRPFIDRYSLATQERTRLFQSAPPHYENVIAVLAADGTRLLTTRETPTERPNFFIRDLARAPDDQLTALTHFPHPSPELRDVQKEQIRYKRGDGVDLTATLMLPAGYEPGRDGPLPVLMWAYPQEFKSASAASQTTGSPHRFNAISFWGPAPMLAMGYAVLDNPSMPIVGHGDEEPNDTYLAQLVASAEAAVDELVRRGVAERHRVAIGGHSYGAFMTANLLAHTRLFKAGIARSGAYNRTLTPFGFQAEERQFWSAKEVYQAMSPFNFADQIKDALLLIHGEQDNNSGTFPIQSERMFQAMKGLGGTARLVMLPNESHAYRARESFMHMLYEMNAWLDKYVKNAAP